MELARSSKVMRHRARWFWALALWAGCALGSWWGCAKRPGPPPAIPPEAPPSAPPVPGTAPEDGQDEPSTVSPDPVAPPASEPGKLELGPPRGPGMEPPPKRSKLKRYAGAEPTSSLERCGAHIEPRPP
jgi:hypothetical protein